MNNNNMKEEKHRLGVFFLGGGVTNQGVPCTILSNCDPTMTHLYNKIRKFQININCCSRLRIFNLLLLSLHKFGWL